MDLEGIKPNYKWSKNAPVRTIELHNKFINWVKGEFDLYLITELNILKVYFPNGWFSINYFNGNQNGYMLEMKVVGKSKIACEKAKNQLIHLYNHLIEFQSNKR